VRDIEHGHGDALLDLLDLDLHLEAQVFVERAWAGMSAIGVFSGEGPPLRKIY
jgi:hypothetical protein